MLNYASIKPPTRPALHCTGSIYNKSCHTEAIFKIYEFDTSDQSQPRLHRPAARNVQTIIWVREGWGELLIDLQRHDFYDNTIFYLQPGQLYQLGPQAKAAGYHISFPASLLNMSEMFIDFSGASLPGQQKFFKTVICEASINNDLQDLVQEMIKECGNSCLLGPEVLRGLIGIFMVHLARTSSPEKSRRGTSHDDQLAKKFLNLLNDKVYTRKMVSDYANELAISTNYLNQVMKRCTGYTASQHIQQYTILEAKRRALYFGTTMKETAYYLGFDDLAHFSKYFKKNAGTSFREFQNQMKSNARADTIKRH